MGNRGTYKYICEECQAENWLTARDRGSRFKPRCTSCGSPWIKPSKASRGPKKIVNALDASYTRKKLIDKKMGKR